MRFLRLLGIAVLGSAPVRFVTRVVIGVGRSADRIASAARFRALVKDAGDSVCHWTSEIKYPENLRLGRRVIIGPHCTLGAAAPITLKDHVRLSKGVMLETAGLDFTNPPPYAHLQSPITLERGVWVGAHAIVLGGVTVGEYSIIGAGAVISRNVPPYSIVTGYGVRVRSRAGFPVPPPAAAAAELFSTKPR